MSLEEKMQLLNNMKQHRFNTKKIDNISVIRGSTKNVNFRTS